MRLYDVGKYHEESIRLISNVRLITRVYYITSDSGLEFSNSNMENEVHSKSFPRKLYGQVSFTITQRQLPG